MLRLAECERVVAVDTSQVVTNLTRLWQTHGVSNGDTLLLHTSVSRTMRAIRDETSEFKLEHLLQSFIEAVGQDGTLLLPLFNFGFAAGDVFDYRSTPSHMGALTEVARHDTRFARTQHPLYSFAVMGRHADDFTRLSNVGALSDDGPFGLLRRLDGKIGVLDLEDQDSMTIYHHIEEVVGVDYRYHKWFSGEYVDADGVKESRRYSLFVWDERRDVRTDVNRAGELLWNLGCYRGDRPGVDSGLRIIRAKEMFDVIRDVIVRGDAAQYLYSIGSRPTEDQQ